MRGYTQLTQEKRYQIYVPMKADHNQAEIARLLVRDKSNISRKLGRIPVCEATARTRLMIWT